MVEYIVDIVVIKYNKRWHSSILRRNVDNVGTGMRDQPVCGNFMTVQVLHIVVNGPCSHYYLTNFLFRWVFMHTFCTFKTSFRHAYMPRPDCSNLTFLHCCFVSSCRVHTSHVLLTMPFGLYVAQVWGRQIYRLETQDFFFMQFCHRSLSTLWMYFCNWKYFSGFWLVKIITQINQNSYVATDINCTWQKSLMWFTRVYHICVSVIIID